VSAESIATKLMPAIERAKAALSPITP
jgi:hypothetical protein